MLCTILAGAKRLGSSSGATYANFSSACMRMIRDWMKCFPTTGPRRILRQSSPIGSTNPEPKPLALDPAALIAVHTPCDAGSSQPNTMDWAYAYETNELMRQQQKATSLAYPSASKVKSATFFDRYAGLTPRHGFQSLFTRHAKPLRIELAYLTLYRHWSGDMPYRLRRQYIPIAMAANMSIAHVDGSGTTVGEKESLW